MRRVLALAALLHPASAAKPPAQLFLSYYSGVSPSVRVCASSPPRERWNPNALALRPDNAVRPRSHLFVRRRRRPCPRRLWAPLA